jgi:hypothetical protein
MGHPVLWSFEQEVTQVPPLRFASVGMTELEGASKSETQVTSLYFKVGVGRLSGAYGSELAVDG